MADDWLTTSLILDRMRAGDSGAWSMFVERFRDPVRRLALRRGLDEAEAEDAAQQVLATFHKGLGAGRYDRGKGRLSAWLFGIARHEIDRARQRSQRRERLGLAGRGDTFPSGVPDDANDVDWNHDWQQHVLSIALARVQREVQPQTWAAFDRVQLHGENPADVAAALGMTRNSVFVAKHRVLARLRALELELDDDLTGARP